MDFLSITPLELRCSLAELYWALCRDAEVSFWLDSARDESPMARFSYLGVAGAAEVFRVDEARTRPRLWEELDAAVLTSARIDPGAAQNVGYPLGSALDGGYVGFMGYEARAALGYEVSRSAETPDAWWLPATSFVAFDHVNRRAWAVGSESWTARVAALASSSFGELSREDVPSLAFPLPDSATYLAQIADAQREIFEGNSYEVCLTAETSASGVNISHESAFSLYCAQREHNPAPYAAFINGGDFFALSSSPERFLTADTAGRIETKPIKGTIERSSHRREDARRAHWLTIDPKTRAENLMIVDLLRNDLSRVCDPATVKVPVLMGVESYSTVHQLVSTICGRLKPGQSAVSAAAACFPGGSMTGAPKDSTMMIIDRLENRARGVYSGCLGFFSASGAANLSIVIRTLVAFRNGKVSLSAGGAIVADSDPHAEYEEMLAKLRAAVPPASLLPKTPSEQE